MIGSAIINSTIIRFIVISFIVARIIEFVGGQFFWSNHSFTRSLLVGALAAAVVGVASAIVMAKRKCRCADKDCFIKRGVR